jgi:glycosyltransferase involved in cell wall biosynthesis
MNRWRCGAVVIARDEGRIIRACLESLRKQTVRLFLVVVNDGSLDDTGDVASEYADVVVNLRRHEGNWTGLPELAVVFNAGFNVLKEKDVEYVLISGADGIYPPNYVEEITGKMEAENVVIASSALKAFQSFSPRACGRVIDAEWFGQVEFKYPSNYAFEAYLVYKALSQGRRVALYSDVPFDLLREPRLTGRKLYLWGKGMKALSYWWPYAFGRAVLAGLRNPMGGFELLMGYLSKVSERYVDLRSFVPSFQRRVFIRKIIEVLGS